jgi:hypothetical protein
MCLPGAVDGPAVGCPVPHAGRSVPRTLVLLDQGHRRRRPPQNGYAAAVSPPRKPRSRPPRRGAGRRSDGPGRCRGYTWGEDRPLGVAGIRPVIPGGAGREVIGESGRGGGRAGPGDQVCRQGWAFGARAGVVAFARTGGPSSCPLDTPHASSVVDLRRTHRLPGALITRAYTRRSGPAFRTHHAPTLTLDPDHLRRVRARPFISRGVIDAADEDHPALPTRVER